QVAQVELAYTCVFAVLRDEMLRPREGAHRREQLHGHVCQALELLLPVDDVSPVMPDRALRHHTQLGDVLLEILPVRCEPRTELDVERRGGTESTPQPRRGEPADETEILERPSKRRADLLQLLGGALDAVQRDEQTQNLVRALEDSVDP